MKLCHAYPLRHQMLPAFLVFTPNLDVKPQSWLSSKSTILFILTHSRDKLEKKEDLSCASKDNALYHLLRGGTEVWSTSLLILFEHHICSFHLPSYLLCIIIFSIHFSSSVFTLLHNLKRVVKHLSFSDIPHCPKRENIFFFFSGF